VKDGRQEGNKAGKKEEGEDRKEGMVKTERQE
jgi:hypothetical protein